MFEEGGCFPPNRSQQEWFPFLHGAVDGRDVRTQFCCGTPAPVHTILALLNRDRGLQLVYLREIWVALEVVCNLPMPQPALKAAPAIGPFSSLSNPDAA